MEGQGGGVDLAFIRRYGRRVSFVRLFKRVMDRFNLSVCLFGIMSRISTSTYLDTFSQPTQLTGKRKIHTLHLTHHHTERIRTHNALLSLRALEFVALAWTGLAQARARAKARVGSSCKERSVWVFEGRGGEGEERERRGRERGREEGHGEHLVCLFVYLFVFM